MIFNEQKVLMGIVGLSTFLSVILICLVQAGGASPLAQGGQLSRGLDVTRMSPAESERFGWSPERLNTVFDYTATLSSDTLMIVTKGKAVGTFGDLKKTHNIHSIRKAFLSALMGQHVGTGKNQIRLESSLQELGIDDTPGPLSHRQKQVKVEHLLKSISGVNHPAAAGGGFVSETNRLLGNDENEPGTKWAYNNWDYNVLTTIYETCTDTKIAEGFNTGIAQAIGMEDFKINDASYLSAPELSQHKAAMFRMSARDLAKFGQLYLEKGQFRGKQVIPAQWIERITKDFTLTGRDDRRWGHGYLWWIPSPKAGLPKGSFWAWGLGNQALFVIPEWDTVIVHQSDTTEFLKRFIPMVTSGQDAESAIVQLILSCRTPANKQSEYCVEHRFTTAREFEKLISLIVEARL